MKLRLSLRRHQGNKKDTTLAALNGHIPAGDSVGPSDVVTSPPGSPWLSGWQLVVALLIVGTVAIATLWLTESVQAVLIVVTPLLIMAGVSITTSRVGRNSL